MKLKVGITGGIGSGKSIVSKIFRSYEVPVFEADAVGRQLLEDREVQKLVVQVLGEAVKGPDGLDRRAIAAVVFEDESKLNSLNSIIHPRVAAAFERWVEEQSAPYILKEAAILFESGSNLGLDKVIVVDAPEDLRISRVVERDGSRPEEVKSRMANQWPGERIRDMADFIISNDVGDELIPQVHSIHTELLSLANA